MVALTHKRSGAVGVADHAGWAILVTVDAAGGFVDRRRVDLVGVELPKMPYHHDAQGLPFEQAAALIERVASSARSSAAECLEALAATVAVDIAAIALRVCPPLPETVAERLANYRAQNVADWVMYRQALASAAVARGWAVHWYDARRVLQHPNIAHVLDETGAALGPPWQKDHRVAMAAAIAANLVPR